MYGVWHTLRQSTAQAVFGAMELSIKQHIKREYRLHKLYNQAAHPWRYYFLESLYSLMSKLGWLVLVFVAYVLFQYTFGNNDPADVEARVSQPPPETTVQAATTAPAAGAPLADNTEPTEQAAVEPVVVSAPAETIASTTAHVAVAPVFVAEIVGPEWLLEQPGGMYTIQFASSTEIDQLVEVTRAVGGESDFVIYPFKNTSDGVLYGLATGSYETYRIALQDVERLPEGIRNSDPWIRSIDKLQLALRSFKNF